MQTRRILHTSIVLALCLGACAKNESSSSASAGTTPRSPAKQMPSFGATAPSAKPGSASAVKAAIGQLAPEFSLPSLDGKIHTLSDYRGKTVVLEWFNPDCPFVRQSHQEGSLKGSGSKWKKKGIVWLAINSNAPGRQGSSRESNERGAKRFNIDYTILMDPTGKVGRRYGATRTPEMFVIDPKGRLRYAGAVDNSRGGDIEDVPNLQLFVDQAIAAIAQQKPLVQAQTKPWGCSVKYAP